MKLGKVVVSAEYVVDMDNEEMVRHAKDCLWEDVMCAVKYDELGEWLDVVEAPDADESDIPEFLLDEDEEND